MLKLRHALALLAMIAAPALAQNTPTTSGTRVQGTPDGKGDPVQVTIVGSNGADTTLTVNSTATGNVASGATDSGNPVKVGGKYNSALPTLTDGQRGDVQLDSSSRQRVVIESLNGITGGSAPSDASASTFSLQTKTYLQGFNGATWDRMRGDTNGLAVQPALSANFWNYPAATGGIVNTTTAVTIKAAAGASVRNYLCSLQVAHDALGGATELVVNDGAAGTVLYRGKLQTTAIDSAGGAGTIVFSPCLKGTANTLMEVKTVTAVTGGVFVDAQGYTGS